MSLSGLKTCFVCETQYDPATSPLHRCPLCLWSEPHEVSSDEPRQIILESLIRRARQDGISQSNYETILRIVPTAREFAMLHHGDQCRVDGALWRITAKNHETGVFWIRGWKAGRSKLGSLVRVHLDQDLEEAIRQRDLEEEAAARRREEAERRQSDARAAAGRDRKSKTNATRPPEAETE